MHASGESASTIAVALGLDLELLQRLQGAVGLPRIEDPAFRQGVVADLVEILGYANQGNDVLIPPER
jgi:hypothetical protein